MHALSTKKIFERPLYAEKSDSVTFDSAFRHVPPPGSFVKLAN